MIRISLTKGLESVIDDVDSDLASLKWCASNGRAGLFYAVRTQKSIPLHRVILERMVGRKLNRNEHTDHINRNSLDNRRCNLRLASHTQNFANSDKQMVFNNKQVSSKYKGVCWDKSREKWLACIGKNNQQINLGRFDDEVEAAKAYDRAALQHFGEFANINFPGKQ